MMLLRLVALCLPLAAWAASPCQSNLSTDVLTCQNIPLADVLSHYSGETLLKLDNVTGGETWNVTNLHPVNTIVATRSQLNQQALASLLTLPHLSSLEFTDSKIEITDTSIFSNKVLRRLRLISSLKNSVDEFTFDLLTELDLSGNKMLKVPKIHGERITYLNLASTGIRKVENMEMMPLLEELDLSNNGLRSVDKNAFAANHALDKLWLQNNNLRNVTFNASELHILNLNYNDLAVIDGDFFAGMPGITNLNLVGNAILELVNPFKNLLYLKVVDLSDNNISVLDGAWFENLTELEVLRMSHNGLLVLPSLNVSLHNLHYLNVSQNPLQVLNADFFKQTPNLATLDITHNELKSIDNVTPYLRILNKLHAAFNFLLLTDKTFAKTEMLNFVNVSHNGLNIAADVFNVAPSLKEVDLSYNGIKDFCNGIVPKYIEDLDIRFNQLTSLKCLTGLESVDVDGNPLLCDLPSQPSDESTLADGDWQAVYNKLCPAGAKSPAPKVVNTPEPPSPAIMHDIIDKPNPVDVAPADESSEDDDEDDDEIDDEDDDDDDDEYEVNIERQSQRGSINDLDKKLHDMHNGDLLSSWAFALLGVCLLLLLVNLLMFVWYRRRERKDAHLGSDRPYEQLHNEVYKNTTTRVEGVHRPRDIRQYFSALKNEKLHHIVAKLGVRSPATDAESQTRMIPSDVAANQIA